ncbi:DegV family protein [Mycoplasma procyoni]|uniref:DegV family protein n=1 Tax=Mycoplasma procyoni TaxID=568784 RepID=UPI00197B91A8|nr:DegV family protein [Mycoplasma procyoni]MBN3534627.1 DegV family protein [Mycoplasma procyoni]
MKIAIIVDSASGLTQKMAKNMDLFFFPLYISANGKEYADGIDLESGEILKYIDKDSKVSTASTPIGYALEMVEELSKTYDKIVIYPISEKLSGQYANLKVAFNQNPKVHVIKSNKVTVLTVLDVLRFKKNIANGMSFEEAVAIMEKDFEGRFLLIPKHNDALVRGGRLSPAAASIAKLLKIVPVIKLENGALQKEGKGRVFRKTLLNYYKETVDAFPKDFVSVVIHSGNSEIEEIVTEFSEYSNSKIEVFTIPNTIAIHTGVEAVAFGVIHASEEEIKALKTIFELK